MPTVAKSEFTPMIFRLGRGTIDQLDALAALPEFGGNRTAVLRMLIAKNFAEKFPSGMSVVASPSKSGTSAPRKTGRKS